MSRGRKATSNFKGSDWESVFYNSVGTYVQCINKELSNKYKLEPLSNHLKIVGGYAFKTAEYKKQGVPIIRISDFSNEKVDLDNVVFYEESKDLQRFELEEGDIIIALTGGTIAKLAIVQADLGKIYLNQRVGKFKVLNAKEFEAEYIYWIARSVQSIIKNLAWGAAIPNVSPKQIEELEFPFPDKSTQKGIIAFLNDLKTNNLEEGKKYFNAVIENKIILLHEGQITTSLISSELAHQRTLVKNLRQQLLQDAVQGKLVKNGVYTEGGLQNVGEVQNLADVSTPETAHALLKKIKAEKEQLIKAKKLKKEKELPPIKAEDIPFEIPEDWVWCRLGEICNNITKGSSPKWQGVNYVDEGKGILYITSKNVDSFKIDLTKATYVEEKFNEIEPRSILKKGDILTNIVGASIGRTALFDLDVVANINQAVCILRIEHTNIDKNYLIYLMNSDFALKMMSDSQFAPGRANLSMGNIATFLIPLPPLAEQHRIVAKIDSLMQVCTALDASIESSVRTNEALLQQVLREALGG